MRDRLGGVLRQLDRKSRLLARSTASDAGTEITGPEESSRSSLVDVVAAAAERVTQSLRQVEEASKILSESVAADFKQLRYAAYDDLARIELRLSRPAHGIDAAQLYLLIDCSKPLHEFGSYIAMLAEAGVDWFQLRDKVAEGGQLLAYARAAKQALAASSSKLIVNDRLDIAMACGADGVHLGQDDLGLEDARRLVGNSILIGISTHSVEQARRAEQAGADYIGCGPTFPSTTKTFSEFVGPALIAQVCQQVRLPVFAIGGIEYSNLEYVMQAGCPRVALSGAIHQASDPAQAASMLKQKLATEGHAPIPPAAASNS